MILVTLRLPGRRKGLRYPASFIGPNVNKLHHGEQDGEGHQFSVKSKSELLDLDIQCLNPVGDLAWGHAEDAGGLGLDPAGLFQRGDDPFLF